MSTAMTKREIADEILAEFFAYRTRVPIAEVVAAGQERGISRRTLTKAAVDFGIHNIHNGPYGGFWEKTE